MAKGVSVGVEITGKDKGFKSAAEDAARATAKLEAETRRRSREIEQQFKNVTIAAAKITAAVVAAQKGFEFLAKGMKQTGQGADDLEKFTTKVKAGFDALAESVFKLDFANMINNWKMASKAAGDYAESMDLVNDRLQDLAVKRAAVASSVQMLRAKQAEGTITKEESKQLKTNTEDLLNIERNIYDEAIKAQVKFIAEKKGLNAELFRTLENGINQRVAMSTEELDELQKSVKLYADYETKLKQKYTTVATTVNTGGGIMGTTGTTTLVTDMKKVNEELSKYLAAMPEAQRLQIFQQQIAGEETFKKLIEFYVKRNELEGEYASLLRRTISAGNAADKGNKRNPSNSFEERMFVFSNLPKQGLKDIKENPINEQMNKSLKIVDELDSAFQGFFQNMGNGFDNMAKAFAGALQQMVAQLAAKAAVFGILQLLFPGSAIAARALTGLRTFLGVPGYANGTNFAPGGLSLVGERGPELVNLPRGSQVIPNGGGSLVAKISGTDLLIIMDRANRQMYNNT